jgi:hypothetical protein
MTLELPICSFDAKTGLLCPICQAKVASGQVSEADVQVSRALITAAGRFKALSSVSLVRAYRVEGGGVGRGGGDYLVEVREPGLAILREKEVRYELGRILGGRVWVAGSSGSSRRLIEDILQPLRVIGFGTTWLPDGSSQTKVIVDESGRGLTRRLEAAKRILKAARGIDLVVEFDGPAPEVRHQAPPAKKGDANGEVGRPQGHGWRPSKQAVVAG